MSTPKQPKDSSTEERIKEAAHKVFMQKGYAGARTRDIAEEAGINLALLNYYFRSKEKLFELVMLERMQQMLQGVREIVYDPATTLEQKVDALVGRYTDLVASEPDLPLFVFGELRTNPQALPLQLASAGMVRDSVFYRQVQERKPGLDPLHVFANLVGMVIFPVVGGPIVRHMGAMDHERFQDFLQERRRLIPVWIAAMFA